ncbi:MAG: sorbosone dehydrogenase family protein [Pseudomonadota bacterium]
MPLLRYCTALAALFLLAPAGAADLPLAQLQVPAGFHIELLARVPNAREMVLGKNNVVYIGSMKEGKVHALELDAQYRAGALHVIASGLNLPAGVAYRDGSLYVSAVDRLLRFDGIDKRLANPPKPHVLRDDLPKETHHGWRFIAFGPDGMLYLPLGTPCNICDRQDPAHYASIVRMKPDGSGQQVVARGVRNSVGFDFEPGTGELWFTDNGRDMLGDEIPPDELNHVSKLNEHFGYPHCHAGFIVDPEFGGNHACSEFTAPVQALGPHVASLGMRFYTGTQFPAAYHKQVFIAEHGSWNRSKKSGYRVSLVTLSGGKAVSYTPFVTGWLQGETAWGRPADVLVLPDGSLLIADDFAGAIYRVSYGG